MNNSKYLSIDIGGSKIRVINFDNNLSIIKEKVYPTSKFFKIKNINGLKKLLKEIRNNFGKNFYKIGISFNCAIKNNKIFYSSLLGGKVNLDLKKFVKKYIDFTLFSSDNDVINMAKAEIKIGLGKIYKNFLYINLGTGIRLVCVEDKKILRGYSNLAGEVSNDKIWVSEINKYEKVDNVIPGKGFINLSKKIFNRKINAEEAFKNNKKELIFIFVKYLHSFLERAFYFYNPEVIIFGGSLILSSKIWLKEFKESYFNKNRSIFYPKKIFISNLTHPSSIGAII